MLCYTSEEEAKKNRKSLPSGDKRKIKCLPLSVRDVINNALMKDSIIDLSFDSESSHCYVIPAITGMCRIRAELQRNIRGRYYDFPSFSAITGGFICFGIRFHLFMTFLK